MARRRHSLSKEGAEATAKKTIQRLQDRVKEAQANPTVRDQWISKYFNNLQSYAEDPRRTAEAEAKLAMWYHKRLAEKYKRLAEEEATKTEKRPGYVSTGI